MRLIKTLGAVIVAVLAVGAMATGASAHEFEANAIGLLLLAKGEGPQVFSTLAGTLTCFNLVGHGKTIALKSETQIVTTSYSNCAADNGSVTVKPVEPINTEYEFNAAGTAKILKTVTISATFVGVKCTITVPPQGPLSTVTFHNRSGALLLLAHVTGIETKGVGAGCKEQYSTSKTGLYRGNSIVEADGGTISWK